VFCGRQAIDGDTAQVGPQIAEKLALPQITYAEAMESISDKEIVIRRRLEHGVETVKAALPALVTVTSAAPDCRYPHAHRLLRYAKTPVEMKNADDVNPDFSRLGLAGSPTKVKKVDNVVLAHKDNVLLEPTDDNLNEMMHTLIAEHII
jgi:electron transfer flavoprotein beta subunit